MLSQRLIDVLDVHSGIVCAVGAGGKKSLIYQLAREHPGRLALTATAHTTEVPDDVGVERIIDDDASLRDRVMAAAESPKVAYACPSEKPGRHAGVSPATIRRIHDDGDFAVTFVKADGARMRWIKAPSPDKGEPLLVPGTDTVVTVLGARAIGEALSERVAHRVERLEEILGIRRGTRLTPEAVGRLMASEEGALRGTTGARVVPVINMVDNERREELARAAAVAAIEQTSRFDRVVLCCLRRPSQPVVSVVER
jgi:probable selenium-dependent hydroxylase accessory protein YqeC